MTGPHETSAEALRNEARALGRLILRRDVDAEFVDRYVEAHRHLLTGAQPPREVSLVRVAVARPVLLACLEAAVALVQPDSLLRKKSLLMAAILEASPRYADEFLPRPIGWVGLAFLAIRVGLGSAARLAVGLPALWILRRSA